MQSKSFFLSKTEVFNILALVVSLASAFGYTGELPAEWAVFVPAAVALINIVLRLFVKEKIGGSVARALRRE